MEDKREVDAMKNLAHFVRSVRQQLLVLCEMRGADAASLGRATGRSQSSVYQTIHGRADGHGNDDMKLSTIFSMATALGADVVVVLTPRELQSGSGSILIRSNHDDIDENDSNVAAED